MLEVGAELAERSHVEDSRGVRVADFHPSREQAVHVSLVGRQPFFLRAGEREAVIQGRPRVVARELVFSALSESSKGSIEESFRRDLFRVPFGLAFYRQAVTRRGAEEMRLRGASERAPSRRASRTWGWVGLAAAAAAGAGAGLMYGLSVSSFHDYEKATSEAQASQLKATTQRRLVGSRILAGTAAGLAAAGVVLLVLDSRDSARATATVSVALGPGGTGLVVGVAGSW